MYNDKILNNFKKLKTKIENKNIKIYLCKIFGRRWSFLDGEISTPLPFLYKIKISETYGITIFCNDNIDIKKCIKFIKGFFNG